MANFQKSGESQQKQGAVPHPDFSTCQQCGRDTHKPGQGQARIIARDRRGELREYAAGEVISWKDKLGGNNKQVTDWSSTTMRSGYDFVKWLSQCNDCFFDPARTTAQQRQNLRDDMDENEITPKTTQKAYRIIQQLINPDMMGHCKANAKQRDYAAKVVLWHWPKASNEPLPDDIRQVCHDQLIQPA